MISSSISDSAWEESRGGEQSAAGGTTGAAGGTTGAAGGTTGAAGVTAGKPPRVRGWWIGTVETTRPPA